MIPLERVRNTTTVHKNFTGPKRLEKALELLKTERDIQSGALGKHDWQSKSAYWKPAKDQLFAETHDKCAYCETPTAVVDYGDVEHFRPKSKYWWLAYCYDNYLVSCAVCNQAFKSDKFPVSGPLWTGLQVDADLSDEDLEHLAADLFPDGLDLVAVEELIQSHHAEQADLVNPYYEDPSDYFAYQALKGLGEVRVVPKGGDRSEQRVGAAIAVYGINRLELCQARFKVFDAFRALWEAAERDDVPDDIRDLCREQVQAMVSDDAPYAGMLRFYSVDGPVYADAAIA